MAGEDPPFVAWVRSLPCLVCGRSGVEAHHAGPRTYRRGSHRADDSTCVPLCTQHHADWHGASGPFREMRKEQRRQWAETAIKATQAAYARSLDGTAFPF